MRSFCFKCSHSENAECLYGLLDKINCTVFTFFHSSNCHSLVLLRLSDSLTSSTENISFQTCSFFTFVSINVDIRCDFTFAAFTIII